MELHITLRNNITDGHSTIFHRYHEKDETFIWENADKVVKTINGCEAFHRYPNFSLTEDRETHPQDWYIIGGAECQDVGESALFRGCL